MFRLSNPNTSQAVGSFRLRKIKTPFGVNFAETVGFEPTGVLLPRLVSSEVPSASSATSPNLLFTEPNVLRVDESTALRWLVFLGQLSHVSNIHN